MTQYIDPNDEDGKAGFERLRQEILRRERAALIRKRIGWAIGIAIAIWLIFYFS